VGITEKTLTEVLVCTGEKRTKKKRCNLSRQPINNSSGRRGRRRKRDWSERRGNEPTLIFLRGKGERIFRDGLWVRNRSGLGKKRARENKVRKAEKKRSGRISRRKAQEKE